MNKAKEKNKKKNTKDEDSLSLDNEIIIGIKTLPNPKNNKKVKNSNKKKKKNKPKLTPKQQEIAKKKRKHVFRIIKWTSLVIILLGGTIAFLLSPFFNIKEICVTGNEKIITDEIISLSQIQLEENIFKISGSNVINLIKENPYVESVKVKRKLPSIIEMQIVERKPAYLITLGNAYVYMNTQGYLLEVSKESLDLPIITGLTTQDEQITPGNRLVSNDLQRLNAVIQIMDSANSNEISNLITKINVSDKQDYILDLTKENKIVHLGDTSNLSTKMLFIKKVIETEKKKEGEIFVNTDLSNKGAIFREKV